MESVEKRKVVQYNHYDINSESICEHRKVDDDLIAEMWYMTSDDGIPRYHSYHRKDGPALIIRDCNDNIINQQFWLCGIYHPDFKKWLTLTPVSDIIKAELALIYG